MPKRYKSPINLMVFLWSALLLLLPSNVIGQTAPVATRDPNAVALAGQSLRALAGLTPLADITLQASVTYTAGSDQEMGAATLVALGNKESLVTLNLASGTRQEIRNGNAGVWTGPDGNPHAMAIHNCWVDAAWFFPALTLSALASDPTLMPVGAWQEVHNGEAVYHLSFLRIISGQTPDVVSLVQRLSAMDVYLDAATLLPVAFDFNTHADNNANLSLPVEIRFGQYQAVNGVQVPTRVQKYLQNSLVLDLTVTRAAVNSGVPAAAFTLPIVNTGGIQ